MYAGAAMLWLAACDIILTTAAKVDWKLSFTLDSLTEGVTGEGDLYGTILDRPGDTIGGPGDLEGVDEEMDIEDSGDDNVV